MLYDSKGREKLEPKDDLASRGVESPDRADALIGAVMMGIGGDPYALNPNSRKLDLELMRDSLQRMQASALPFAEVHFMAPEKHEWN